MNEFLSNSSWQGIGVIVSTLLALLGLLLNSKLKNRVLRSNNSKFDRKDINPRELLDGQNTVIYGKVVEQLFPGPPNYESINNGDAPQFYWILYTNEPIQIVARSMESGEISDCGPTCSFQLAVPSEFYDKKHSVLGKYVEVSGSVLAGHTGHHKTKALIKCNRITVQ